MNKVYYRLTLHNISKRQIQTRLLGLTMNWYMKWIIYELRIWNQVKLWSSQLWTQLLQLRKEAWKIQEFNGVWTRNLAIPVRRSNQLSYEATDVGSWSFLGSLKETKAPASSVDCESLKQ